MSDILWYNNAATTVGAPISPSDVTATLAPGSGALFSPGPTGAEYFCLTFTDALTGLSNEIVHVTDVTGDVITMDRAQEGTVAQSWAVGDSAAALVTAGGLTTLGSEPAPTADRWTTPRNLSLTGDGAATLANVDGSAPVSAALTLATVNANVGTFGNATTVAQFVVNAKGLITSAVNVAIDFATAVVASAGKWTTPRALSFTGDATGTNNVDGSAAVATALTLATVNASTGAKGGKNLALTLTLDGKGRATAAAETAVFPPVAWIRFSVSGGTITGATGFPSNLVASLARASTGKFTINNSLIPANATGWATVQVNSASDGSPNCIGAPADDLSGFNVTTLASTLVDPNKAMMLIY